MTRLILLVVLLSIIKISQGYLYSEDVEVFILYIIYILLFHHHIYILLLLLLLLETLFCIQRKIQIIFKS